mmetsp:Transcript_34959/g.53613  ORF Transcript_34959/g.53613 Transcript_34959/m.53613 type:complete len:85 (+) Transcript_34959:204-458(+)
MQQTRSTITNPILSSSGFVNAPIHPCAPMIGNTLTHPPPSIMTQPLQSRIDMRAAVLDILRQQERQELARKMLVFGLLGSMGSI